MTTSPEFPVPLIQPALPTEDSRLKQIVSVPYGVHGFTPKERMLFEETQRIARDLIATRKHLRSILRVYEREPHMMGGGPDMMDLGRAIRRAGTYERKVPR